MNEQFQKICMNTFKKNTKTNNNNNKNQKYNCEII